MPLCWIFLLNRRSALSKVSFSPTRTSANSGITSLGPGCVFGADGVARTGRAPRPIQPTGRRSVAEGQGRVKPSTDGSNLWIRSAGLAHDHHAAQPTEHDGHAVRRAPDADGVDDEELEEHEIRLDDRPDQPKHIWNCLLYTSDAADDLLCVDLG